MRSENWPSPLLKCLGRRLATEGADDGEVIEGFNGTPVVAQEGRLLPDVYFVLPQRPPLTPEQGRGDQKLVERAPPVGQLRAVKVRSCALATFLTALAF